MRDEEAEEETTLRAGLAERKEHAVEVIDVDVELAIGHQAESLELRQDTNPEVEDDHGQAQGDELEQTPTAMDEVTKVNGDIGSAEERLGRATCGERPRRRTRNMKNSRYDRADYLVDYSGSGQHNKYKLRKMTAEGKDEA